MDSIFQGLFSSGTAETLTSTAGILSGTAGTLNAANFLICIGAALLVGIIMAFVYAFRSRYTKSFILTLVVLPAIVAVVIMMVNGNIGAGVAVAGAFSLVRFRSVPGSAKDIGMIFMAMGAGLICGMGYLAYAFLFTLVMGCVMVLMQLLHVGEGSGSDPNRELRVTVPEDLEYTHLFDDLMEEYTSRNQLVRVKTTAMGSLFKLTWNITLKDTDREKEFIDALRCRNGNLEISMGRQEGESNAL